MDLTVLISAHDAALKASIMSLLSRKIGEDAAHALNPDVREIFKQERADFIEKIEIIFGKEKAQQVIARIKEPV